MESNPGISLFQNSEFNRLEFNLPEPEEIEAAEDEKRRNEELKEMMQNAFDDLEDDSHSVDNSYYDSSQGCDTNSHRLSKDRKHISNETPSAPNHSPRFRSPGYDNYQQLQVLYQVRLREIEKLHNDMETFKESSNREKAQLTEKVILMETEKEKALISFGESQKTLVETQRRLSSCEKELRELKERFIVADSQKNQALHELEMCKLTNRELEQRLVVSERNSYKSEEKNFDSYLKEINSKHKREVADFQKEAKLLSNKLMSKENDCLKLEHQLLDLQRLHESVLVEKSEIINKLTANLEESQSQCQKLISNSTNHDIAKLMNQLRSQKAEINSLSIQVSALKKEKNQLIDQIQKLRSENNHSHSVQNKSHSEELRNIEKKVQQLTLENESLKETISKKEFAGVDEKKEEFLKLVEDNITTDMTDKISKLESDLEESLKECDNVKKLYIEVCIAKDKLLKQNASIEKELNDLKNEKNQMNDIMKNISGEKEELAHKFTLMQDELNKQKNEIESLKNKHEEEMRKTTEKHMHEFDSFKLALKNEFSKVEIFHQDQLSKMELECAKKILEIENNHKTELFQIEANVKEEAVKICSEEIQMLSDSYKKQYDELISRNLSLEHMMKEKIANYEALRQQFDAMKSFQGNDEQVELRKLRAELRNIETKYNAAISEWNEKLNQTNEKHEKLRRDFQEIYNKYKKARKAATTLKETLDERNRFMKERHGQYMQTISEIQNHLNDVLDFKCAENKAMMADLLEGDELAPSKEFATVMCDINQKLLLLKNKTSHEIGIS